jgi:hypothetical protein
VSDEKLRLGGMALRNGLLVHGPTHWAAAVRAPDGSYPLFNDASLDAAPELDHVLALGQDLGLFTPAEMADAFAAVGLEVEYRENEVWNRGLYVARRD